MRIRAFDRVLMVLVVLLLLAVAVFLSAVAFRVLDRQIIETYIEGFYTLWQNIVILLVIAAVLLIIALRLLYAALVPPRRKVRAVVRRTEEGTLSITLTTLQDIAIRSAKTVEGVKDTACEVIAVEGGVRICFKVDPTNEAVLPEMGKQLQTRVKEQVEMLSGIAVKEVNVLVARSQATRTQPAYQ